MQHSESLAKADKLCGGVCVRSSSSVWRHWTFAAGHLFLSSLGLLPWNECLLAAEVHLLAQFPPEGIQGKLSHMIPSYESKSNKVWEILLKGQ